MLLTNKETIKRACIYVFYDKYGRVDDYVFYFLESIRPHVSHLMFVVNGSVRKDYLSRLEKLADDVFIRENNGYDITAYRDGMQRIGWDKLKDFDECILCNSTLYGPFYPFSEMFAATDKKDVDFWGMLKYFKEKDYRIDDCDYDYIPEHIQSYFMALRSTLLSSAGFINKMKDLTVIDNANDAISQFEVVFTKEFADLGYKWDTYIDTEDLRNEENYALMVFPYELISQRRCPVIKQKLFATKDVDFPILDSAEKALEYIDKHTDYDVNMIWRNMLRTMPMDELKNTLRFNYVIGSDAPTTTKRDKRLAAFVYISDGEYLSLLPVYLKNLPNTADIYVFYSDEALKKTVSELLSEATLKAASYIKLKSPSEEIFSANSELAAKYDYICYIKMRRLTHVKPQTNQRLMYEKAFRNTLASEAFVHNVTEKFETNPYLGMLIPKPANHSYFALDGIYPWGCVAKKIRELTAIHFDPTDYEEYTEDYTRINELMLKTGMEVPVSISSAPVSPTNGFCWLRKDALGTVFKFAEHDLEDFFADKDDENGLFMHIPERILPYAIQNEGYFSAYVTSDKFAETELTNLDRKSLYLWDKVIYPHKDEPNAVGKSLTAAKNVLKGILPKKTFRAILRWKRRKWGM